jgi:hypothetical protein
MTLTNFLFVGVIPREITFDFDQSGYLPEPVVFQIGEDNILFSNWCDLVVFSNQLSFKLGKTTFFDLI